MSENDYRRATTMTLAPQPLPANVAPIPPGMRTWEQGPVEAGNGADAVLTVIILLLLVFVAFPLVIVWCAMDS